MEEHLIGVALQVQTAWATTCLVAQAQNPGLSVHHKPSDLRFVAPCYCEVEVDSIGNRLSA